MLDPIISALVSIGVFFTLVGSIGLLRFPDFYARLHAPTKATTLGVGCILLSSILHLADRGGASWREVLVLMFLFLTAPVSAHMLAKAARHLGLRLSVGNDREGGER